MQDVPPPVVDIGPTNQTLATRSAATLPCQASGIPLPTIKWYRNGNYLSPDDPRVTITSSGTLQIDGKRDKSTIITHSRVVYVCRARGRTKTDSEIYI